MLSIHAAYRRTAAPRHQSAQRVPKIGLAIAGGGPIGGMYELGALRALDEALDGLDLTDLDSYVGISSGAFLAAGLANRMTTAQMCRIFVTGDSDDVNFRPQTFLRPAFAEYLRRAAGVPSRLLDWWRALLTGPRGAAWSELVAGVSALLPVGLFDNHEVERFLRDIFQRRGRSNDFRTLGCALFVVAVELDSGEAVVFGSDGWDDVAISRAVQASAALPGLYPPVNLRGRDFVDGALRRTMHASLLLERDIDLLIGVNPLVPFNSSARADAARTDSGRGLARGGLPSVLSQTFRTLLQSRMQVGFEKYARQYPQVDQLVFEPNADDSELFHTNVFSFASRRRVCELAWRNTLDDLRRHADTLRPQLAAHGIRLREALLADSGRTLADGLAMPPPRSTDTTARLRRALDETARLLSRRARIG
ncbi:MAG: patatin-like phospholipase family protein [Luteimonas sp.]